MSKRHLSALLALCLMGPLPGADGEIEIQLGNGEVIKIKPGNPNEGGKPGKGGKKGGTLGSYGPTTKIVYEPLEFFTRQDWWRVHKSDVLFGEKFLARFKPDAGMGYDKSPAEPTDEEIARLTNITSSAAWRGDFDDLVLGLARLQLRQAPRKHLDALAKTFSEADPVKDKNFRRGFLRAFADVAHGPSREAIGAIVREGTDTDEIGLALAALGRLKDSSVRSLILEKAEDTSLPPAVRSMAVLGLREILDDTTAEALITFLMDRAVDINVRRAALITLAHNGRLNHDSLEDLARNDPDPRVRATAIHGMVIDNQLSEDERKLLIKTVDRRDADLRGVAATALHRFSEGDADIKKALTDRLGKEKDFRARKAMAFAVSEMADSNKDLFAVKKLFKKDQHEEVVWFSALGVGLSQFEKAGEIAEKSLKYLNNPVSLEGIYYCMGLIDTPERLELLSAALQDKSQPQLQCAAALALGLRHQADSLPLLTDALSSESGETRRSVSLAVAILDDLARDKAEELAKTSGSDTDREVRVVAALAAELLGREGFFADSLPTIFTSTSEIPVAKCDGYELLMEVNSLFPSMHRTTLKWVVEEANAAK